MRKHILLLTLAIIFQQYCYAQLDYNLTVSTATYTELDTSQHHINDSWDFPFSYTYSQPIIVDFFNIATDHGTWDVNDKGEVVFSGYFTLDKFYVSAFKNDFVGHHGSTIGEVSYIMSGTNPDRILKVQYKDVGFYGETPHTSYANFQIWIYENGDIVEFRYGTSSIAASLGNACKAGIYDVNTSTVKSVELTGNISSPSLAAGNHDLGSALVGIPAANTVYRLTPKTTGINNLNNNKPVMFYSSQDKAIHIKTRNKADINGMQLYNITGEKITISTIQNTEGYTIPVSTLPHGMYIVKVANRNDVYSIKFSID